MSMVISADVLFGPPSLRHILGLVWGLLPRSHCTDRAEVSVKGHIHVSAKASPISHAAINLSA